MAVPTTVLSTPRGPADGPLIVLGASLGTASTVLWEQAAPLLEREFRVSTWDLPGHGSSPVLAEPCTIGELADSLVAAVVELGEASFGFVGVSLTGAVCLELMLRHPERVQAAAIICSGAKIGEASAWVERATLVREQGTRALVAGLSARWFAPDSLARADAAPGRILRTLEEADNESYAYCCEALAHYDVRSRLNEIKLPLLAVWAEHDVVTPESLVRQVTDGVMRGRAIGVANASHLAPADQPELVAAVIAEHFRIQH